jgi:hypothetical protein
MGLRQQINGRSFLGYVTAGILFLFAITMTLWSRANSHPRIILSNQAYYSADDGKTWFLDSVTKPTPFQLSDGRQAVLAHVFSWNGRDNLFIGYLERDDGGDGRVKPAAQAGASFSPGQLGSRMIKRPGDKEWVQMIGSQGMKIMNIRGSDGTGATQMQPTPE